ncbi:thioredoxin-like protein [Syncephalis fuscata]|nr:thioredoxin-like protein [Syncephalis fuscata]
MSTVVSRPLLVSKRLTTGIMSGQQYHCYTGMGLHSNLFNWKATALFVGTGIGLFWYFRSEKKKIEETRKEQYATKSYGKPKLGGPFELVDHHGEIRSDRDFLGKYMLVYFGFTHCPDICPEELDKMAEVVDALDKVPKLKDAVVPVFITLERVRRYVKEFHPKMIGLTGTHEQIAQVARAYRVYYSKPPDAQEGEDYLVDHSIFFYLMDPHGQLADFYGKDFSAEYVEKSIQKHMNDYLATTNVTLPSSSSSSSSATMTSNKSPQ